jgi:hypothetical protein
VASPGCVATTCGLAASCWCWAHRLCRHLASPLVSSLVVLSPLATVPFTTATSRHRCNVSRPRCHRLWRRRVRPFGCVATACGGAVRYRFTVGASSPLVTAPCLPGVGVTACAVAWRHRLCRRRLCCRRLRRCLSLPLRVVAAVTSLGRVATACGDGVCGRFGCVAIACGGAVHYRFTVGASSPLVTAPSLLGAGCHRCDISRLRCHRLWPRRVLPGLGVTACVAA